jgi:hypothetical protein
VIASQGKLEERSGIHSGFVWGHGRNLQEDAVTQYFFHKHMPETFAAEPLLAVAQESPYLWAALQPISSTSSQRTNC